MAIAISITFLQIKYILKFDGTNKTDVNGSLKIPIHKGYAHVIVK